MASSGFYKVFLDGRDVTPRPLVFVTSDDSIGDGDSRKSTNLSEKIPESEEKKIPSSSDSISSSGTSSSSQFRQSLTSPRDLGHIEMPYSNSVMKKYLERFRTPSPKEEIIPKVTQERLTELMETKPTYPMKVILSLKETSTFFLLDRPSLTALEGTEEAEMIKKDNALYDYLTIGEGRRRYTKNAETQTKWKVWKSKAVWAPVAEKNDNVAEASTYDLYQSFRDESSA